MKQKSLNRLSHLIDIIPPLLRLISEEDFSFKPNEKKWSKKQILGHLVDSVTNNHHRFVRAQFEDCPTIYYNQDDWNNHGHYQGFDSRHLIEFWTIYNRHLLGLASQISDEAMQKNCNIAEDGVHTLEYIFDYYITHLEHHLKQLTEY
jgi:hypothetical protein